jgi:hypothetical protein
MIAALNVSSISLHCSQMFDLHCQLLRGICEQCLLPKVNF